MGYNGSENFAKGHRFGFFPAYAVGWMISNEKFWEPILPVVSELKLKASYGSVGNDAIGGDRWIYQSTISTNNGWNYGENGSEGGGGIQVGNVENLNVYKFALSINDYVQATLAPHVNPNSLPTYGWQKSGEVCADSNGYSVLVECPNVPSAFESCAWTCDSPTG